MTSTVASTGIVADLQSGSVRKFGDAHPMVAAGGITLNTLATSSSTTDAVGSTDPTAAGSSTQVITLAGTMLNTTDPTALARLGVMLV